MQYVINQDDVLVVHREREVGRTDLGIHADPREVVPIERDIQGAQRLSDGKKLVQAPGKPYAARVDPDHYRIRDSAVQEVLSQVVGHAADQPVYFRVRQ